MRKKKLVALLRSVPRCNVKVYSGGDVGVTLLRSTYHLPCKLNNYEVVVGRYRHDDNIYPSG